MLKQVLSAFGCAVFIVEPSGVICCANPAAGKAFANGITPKSLPVLAEAGYVPMNVAEALRRFVQRASQGERLVVDFVCRGTAQRAFIAPTKDERCGDAVLLGIGPAFISMPGSGIEGFVFETVNLTQDDMLSRITPKEHEVLALIGEGLSTEAIAERLGRSVKTIEWHRASLGTKLGVTNRVQLARIAIQAGLVKLPAFIGDVVRYTSRPEAAGAAVVEN